MKVTKIKQEIDYDVIAANAHQVKTAPLFHKLPTGKDIMLTLVTHQNVILYKKGYVYLFINPVSHYKINDRYKYIKKKRESHGNVELMTSRSRYSLAIVN